MYNKKFRREKTPKVTEHKKDLQEQGPFYNVEDQKLIIKHDYCYYKELQPEKLLNNIIFERILEILIFFRKVIFFIPIVGRILIYDLAN